MKIKSAIIASLSLIKEKLYYKKAESLLIEEELSQNNKKEKINLILSFILLATIFFTCSAGLNQLNEIDQKKVTLKNQKAVIEMETKNLELLTSIKNQEQYLKNNINTISAAVPLKDEESENTISYLENIALRYGIVIPGINIKKISDSQFYNDELAESIQPFEYSFYIDGNLNQIMGMIDAIKKSLRIMDITTLEIEDNKGNYKANISLFTYNLKKEND